MTKNQMNLCLGHFMNSVIIIKTGTVKMSSAMTEWSNSYIMKLMLQHFMPDYFLYFRFM